MTTADFKENFLLTWYTTVSKMGYISVKILIPHVEVNCGLDWKEYRVLTTLKKLCHAISLINTQWIWLGLYIEHVGYILSKLQILIKQY